MQVVERDHREFSISGKNVQPPPLSTSCLEAETGLLRYVLITPPSVATCCLLDSLPSSEPVWNFSFKRTAQPSAAIWITCQAVLVSQLPKSCQTAWGLYCSALSKYFFLSFLPHWSIQSQSLPMDWKSTIIPLSHWSQHLWSVRGDKLSPLTWPVSLFLLELNSPISIICWLNVSPHWPSQPHLWAQSILKLTCRLGVSIKDSITFCIHFNAKASFVCGMTPTQLLEGRIYLIQIVPNLGMGAQE
jgi:hypothetical protein